MDVLTAVWYLRCVYNTPKGHLRCFVFDKQFEIFLGFLTVKTKA